MVFFVFMMTDVLLRNRKRIEHKLVFGIIACCMSMFTEEFVRHYLPIEYSPMITAAWFSTSGILITGFGLHLFIKLTGMDQRMPKLIFPFFCYIPTLLVVLNLFFNDQMVSGSAFHLVGNWKLPVYNEAYYIAMIGSNVFNFIYVLILLRGKRRTDKHEVRAIYSQLIMGVSVTAFFNLTIGLIDFHGYLPPYPYIYGGLAWCMLLRHTMVKYDFLYHIDKRYEKLFNLNPAAILLLDLHGSVREANPYAKQLLSGMRLEVILNGEIRQLIEAKAAIQNVELTIRSHDRTIDVLIDGDYVTVEYETLLILIMRDVTSEKESQREVAYLAYHDTLTRLPNRRYFLDKLDAAIQASEAQRERLAVVLFDLDYFKELNDSHGHLIGDQALIHVADRIRSVIDPAVGTAARLGGDEFVFFLHPVRSVETVEATILRLQQAMRDNPFLVGGETVPIGLSIGVSICPNDGTDRDALLSSADKALYSVKKRGRNRYAFALDLHNETAAASPD